MSKTATKDATTVNGHARGETPAREVTHEQIALRAYEIYLSGEGGDAVENWLRAEQELRGLPEAGGTLDPEALASAN